MNMTMSTASTIRIICALALACCAQCASAQCPDRASDLTPTIRALLMLERPEALTEEQWAKVIENPANRQDMQVVIYEQDRFDPCELPQGWWYVMYAGERPEGKEVGVVAEGDHLSE